jgi:hypothetical protein
MFSPSPPPTWCRRGCTVPGEGWSPAETEHSGEAPRRRRSPLWCRFRSASPLAAARIGTRSTRGDRRQSRDDASRRCARVVLQCRPSFTGGELRNGSSRFHHTVNGWSSDTGDDTGDTTADVGNDRTRSTRRAAGDSSESALDSRDNDDGRAKGGAGECAPPRDGEQRTGPGHVVRRRTSRYVRQPDTAVRDRAESDECRHRGEHDLRRR